MLFVRAHGSEPVKRDLDTPRARKTSHRAWNSDEDTSEEDEEDIVYADDDEAASDAEVPSNRQSCVTYASKSIITQVAAEVMRSEPCRRNCSD